MRLREVRDGDLDAIFEQQRDPVAVAMAGVPSREREAFDAHWARIRADPVNVLRVIEVDGAVAGTALSFLLDGRRVVGYWLDRAFWGRGLATAALRALLGEIEERPLHATVLDTNAGSLRVLEKCGFRRVGPDGRGGLLLELPS